MTRSSREAEGARYREVGEGNRRGEIERWGRGRDVRCAEVRLWGEKGGVKIQGKEGGRGGERRGKGERSEERKSRARNNKVGGRRNIELVYY